MGGMAQLDWDRPQRVESTAQAPIHLVFWIKLLPWGPSLHSGHSLPCSAAIPSSSTSPSSCITSHYHGVLFRWPLYAWLWPSIPWLPPSGHLVWRTGLVLIHVREKVWYTRGSRQAGPSTSSAPDGERRRGQFTKKGVTLTVDEWERLLQVAADVEAACVAGTA